MPFWNGSCCKRCPLREPTTPSTPLAHPPTGLLVPQPLPAAPGADPLERGAHHVRMAVLALRPCAGKHSQCQGTEPCCAGWLMVQSAYAAAGAANGIHALPRRCNNILAWVGDAALLITMTEEVGAKLGYMPVGTLRCAGGYGVAAAAAAAVHAPLPQVPPATGRQARSSGRRLLQRCCGLPRGGWRLGTPLPGSNATQRCRCPPPPACRSEVRKTLIGRAMCERYAAHLGLPDYLVLGKGYRGGLGGAAELVRHRLLRWQGLLRGGLGTSTHSQTSWQLMCMQLLRPPPSAPHPAGPPALRPAVQHNSKVSANMAAEMFEAVMVRPLRLLCHAVPAPQRACFPAVPCQPCLRPAIVPHRMRFGMQTAVAAGGGVP